MLTYMIISNRLLLIIRIRMVRSDCLRTYVIRIQCYTPDAYGKYLLGSIFEFVHNCRYYLQLINIRTIFVRRSVFEYEKNISYICVLRAVDNIRTEIRTYKCAAYVYKYIIYVIVVESRV